MITTTDRYTSLLAFQDAAPAAAGRPAIVAAMMQLHAERPCSISGDAAGRWLLAKMGPGQDRSWEGDRLMTELFGA